MALFRLENISFAAQFPYHLVYLHGEMVQAFSYWTDDKLESKNKCQNKKERNQSFRIELHPQTWFWNHLKIKLIASFYLSSWYWNTCISSLPVSSLLIIFWLHFPPFQHLPSGQTSQRLSCQDIELKWPFSHVLPAPPANSPLLKTLSLSPFFSSLLSCQLFLNNSENIADRFFY